MSVEQLAAQACSKQLYLYTAKKSAVFVYWEITRPWKIIRVFIQVYLKDGHIEAATDDEIKWSQTIIRQQQDMNMLTGMQDKERDYRCVCLNKLLVKQWDNTSSTLHKHGNRIIVIPGKWSLLLPMSSYSGLGCYQCKLLQIGISELCQQNLVQNKQMKVLNIMLAE